MAKRSRGVRPGQRRPLQRRATQREARPARPAATPATQQPAEPSRTGALTDEELARAAEIEARILAEERAAESRRRARDRDRADLEAVPRSRGGSAGPATLAGHEYDYVVRDLRRIGLVAGSLLAILFALWVLIELTRVVPLV